MTGKDTFTIALTSTDLAGLSADAREVVVCPAGKVASTNGPFIMDAQAADLAIRQFNDHGVRLPIDYEHATLVKGEQGEPAPAVGWILSLRFDDSRGLLASAEWTDEGREAIKSGKYAYLSPVVAVRKTDSRAVALHSAALTNKPAIPNMQRLAASATAQHWLAALADQGGGDTADDTAGDDDKGERIRELLAALRDALGLAEDATAADVAEAIVQWGSDSEGTVAGRQPAPVDAVAMRAQVKREVQREADIEAALLREQRAGKLNRNDDRQMAWARSVACHDVALFTTLMTAAPVIVPQGKTRPPAYGAETSLEQQAVIRQARARFQSDPSLRRVTDEEAVVNLALREAGFEPIITPGGLKAN